MRMEIQISETTGKINHLMYIYNIKIYAKNEKELENFEQTIRNIQPGY